MFCGVTFFLEAKSSSTNFFHIGKSLEKMVMRSCSTKKKKHLYDVIFRVGCVTPPGTIVTRGRLFARNYCDSTWQLRLRRELPLQMITQIMCVSVYVLTSHFHVKSCIFHVIQIQHPIFYQLHSWYCDEIIPWFWWCSRTMINLYRLVYNTCLIDVCNGLRCQMHSCENVILNQSFLLRTVSQQWEVKDHR